MKAVLAQQKRPLTVLSLMVLMLLSACNAPTIVLEGVYPSPLMSKLPLTVGVYYNDSLQNFIYTEPQLNSDKPELLIDGGNTQQGMFSALLPSVFDEVVVIDSLDNIPERYPQLDAVFVPVIDDFQLGLPSKTYLPSYEVWIKYNMRLSEANGDYIADWVMSAYGKSPSNNNRKNGINDAANLAMRDLSASFALEFNDVPDIRSWLNRKGINN